MRGARVEGLRLPLHWLVRPPQVAALEGIPALQGKRQTFTSSFAYPHANPVTALLSSTTQVTPSGRSAAIRFASVSVFNPICAACPAVHAEVSAGVIAAS